MLIDDARIGVEKIARLIHQGEIVYPKPIMDGLLMWNDFMGIKNNDVYRQVVDDLSNNLNYSGLLNFAFEPGSGYEGDGLKFDSIDDYVIWGQTKSTQESTIEMVFKPNSYDTRSYLIFYSESGAVALTLQLYSESRFRIRLYAEIDNTGTQLIDKIPKLGVLNHVAVRYNKQVTLVYLNGELVFYFPSELGGFGRSRNRVNLTSGDGYDGVIYSIRYYGRALAEAEIMHNYNMDRARFVGWEEKKEPIKDGLLLHYDFKEKKNTHTTRDFAIDLSGNGNHGDMQNFAYEAGSGFEGGGLRFDGVDDYLETPFLSPNMAEVTLEFVLKGSHMGYSRAETLVSRKHPVNSLLLHSGRFYLYGRDGATGYKYFNHVGVIDDKKLRHFVIKYNGDLVTVFLDGVIAYQENHSFGFMGGPSQFTGGWGIRFQTSSGMEVYSVKIYDRYLTDDETLFNYNYERERWGI